MTLLRLTHIGGPTTLLEVAGWRILTDPTFDDPGRTYRFGWGTSSRKLSPPAIPVSDIGHLDAILLTHDHHADNLDDTGRELLPQVDNVLTTMPGAARLGAHAQGLRPWGETELAARGRPAITVTATPARHGPPGSRPIVGSVTGFALAWPGQQHGVVWISGDTVMYSGVRSVASRLDIGTVILHLGRVRFPITGPVSYTMRGADVLELTRLMEPHTLLPVHHEGWSHFTQGKQQILADLADAPHDVLDRIRWPAPGRTLEVTV